MLRSRKLSPVLDFPRRRLQTVLRHFAPRAVTPTRSNAQSRSAGTSSAASTAKFRFTFDNSFTRTFAADPIKQNGVRQVRALYSEVQPERSPNPRLLAWSPRVAQLLGFEPSEREKLDTKWLGEVFSGNDLPDGAQPFACTCTFSRCVFSHCELFAAARICAILRVDFFV